MGKEKAPVPTQKQAEKPGKVEHVSAPPKAPKGGGADAGGRCLAQGCKRESDRFDFCAEHFEHFKFGLVTKTGKQVSDYDKKIDHYNAYVARTGSGRKVA